MRTLSIAAALLIMSNQVQSLTIGSTLAQCQAVASMFRNTCTQAPSGPATWGTAFQGATVTCTQPKCPDNASGNSCTWSRQLCVSCSQVGQEVYIRVQTNGLPDHCYASPQVVLTQKADYTVLYNPSIQGQKLLNFTSQAAFDDVACVPAKTQSIPTQSQFSYTSGVSGNMNMDTAVGVAINGVMILSSSSLNNVDPFYPRAWSGTQSATAELVDGCLAHPQGSGIYHYHILPPCVVNAANLQSTKPCAGISACATDLAGYALASYDNYKSEMVLGLAKDGHMILGPYHDDGTLYDCHSGFDQCSGTTSADGSYVYIFQNKYPYDVACFGPAVPVIYQPSCSTNTCNPQSAANAYLMRVTAMILILFSASHLF